MNFALSAEQRGMRESVRRLLAERCPPAQARAMLDDELGHDPELWRAFGDLGLLGLRLPAAHGGSALGMVESAVVLEELGKVVCTSPFLVSALLAAPAIVEAGAAVRATWLPRLASGETLATLAVSEADLAGGAAEMRTTARVDGTGFTLEGTKRFVPFAHAAGVLVLAARAPEGITLFAVPRDAPGLALRPVIGIDHTRRMSEVFLRGVHVGRDAVIGLPGQGWALLGPLLRRAGVGAAAELVGVARACLEMSVSYAKVRRQFGQPIGSFQAVKHMCADMLVDVETASGATYRAAWTLDADDPGAPAAAAAAKAHASDAARRVVGSALRVHAGIGFTWDFDLHLYFKRAHHDAVAFGDADFHREEALRAILGGVP